MGSSSVLLDVATRFNPGCRHALLITKANIAVVAAALVQTKVETRIEARFENEWIPLPICG
jgi:hypothetical protein